MSRFDTLRSMLHLTTLIPAKQVGTLVAVVCLLAGGCTAETDDADPVGDLDSDSALTGKEDEMTPPANWSDLDTTSTTPVLWVYASSAHSGSGTNNDIELIYGNASGKFSCTISGGVPGGTWKSCTPTQISTTNAQIYGIDQFWLGYANGSDTDGLEFSSVKAVISGQSFEVAYFETGDFTDLDCSGNEGGWGPNTGKCWIDGDSRGGCTQVRIKMEGEYSWTNCSRN